MYKLYTLFQLSPPVSSLLSIISSKKKKSRHIPRHMFLVVFLNVTSCTHLKFFLRMFVAHNMTHRNFTFSYRLEEYQSSFLLGLANIMTILIPLDVTYDFHRFIKPEIYQNRYILRSIENI